MIRYIDENAMASTSGTLELRQVTESGNGIQYAGSRTSCGPNFEAGEPEESRKVPDRPRIIDPFDPENHRKSQDPRLNLGLDQHINSLPNTVEVRKPKKSWFIRIHPDPNYRAVLRLYTDDDSKRRENNSYLFAPGLEVPPELECLVRDTLVAAAITSSGVLFLYPLSVTESSWYEGGVEVFRRATEEWVRVTPGDGTYVITLPIAKLEEPHFPDVPFREYIERAFSKRLIKSLEDPLIKKLRGIR
jgi:hypothetical protein